MATFNGEVYLADQLESIIWQTYTHWILFVRDDGSTDGTPGILKHYARNYPSQIIIVEDDQDSKGPQNNFNMCLLAATLYSNQVGYFMFADQDDVWLADKVERTMSRMRRVEESSELPALIHTDLCVVDANLNPLSYSFWSYRALDPFERRLSHLLIQNNVTGCTMLWNRKLNDLVVGKLGQSAMHDWWIALVAACFGRIEVLAEPTILYRQHGRNSVGATNVRSIGFIASRLLGANHVRSTLEASVGQAQALLSEYSDRVPEGVRDELKCFSEIYSLGIFGRRFQVVLGGYYKQGPIQAIGELLFL